MTANKTERIIAGLQKLNVTCFTSGGYMVKEIKGFYFVRRPGEMGNTLVCRKRSISSYIEEVIFSGNECAELWEVFSDKTGNKYLYWVDTETGEQFITALEEVKQNV